MAVRMSVYILQKKDVWGALLMREECEGVNWVDFFLSFERARRLGTIPLIVCEEWNFQTSLSSSVEQRMAFKSNA